MNEELFTKLKEKVMAKLTTTGSYDTNIYGMQFYRDTRANRVNSCIQSPFIILMLNGEKHSVFGSEEFTYGAGKYAVACVDYPVSSYITNISEDNPYLSILLPIDSGIVYNLISTLKSENEEHSDEECFCGISIADAYDDILDAFLRLVELIDKPDDIDVLAPMFVKEIFYRILKGPIGNSLKSIYSYDSKSGKIMYAVNYLKDNYKENIKIEQLASIVNMALSTFNRYFRVITTLSPLQYQKRLRLYEAQRLMLMEDYNATMACYEVGYSSLNQFNREYKKVFGEPPYNNVKKIIAAL